jgi:hypothetical protein
MNGEASDGCSVALSALATILTCVPRPRVRRLPMRVNLRNVELVGAKTTQLGGALHSAS